MGRPGSDHRRYVRPGCAANKLQPRLPRAEEETCILRTAARPDQRNGHHNKRNGAANFAAVLFISWPTASALTARVKHSSVPAEWW
jgi:hypothetical protein